MTDRHRQARVYIRATTAQADAWANAAAQIGVPLNVLAATALDSFVASLRTATLRGAKADRAKARVRIPCIDTLCSLESGHAPPCNFGRPENG
jgi:hypothetical protein